MPLECCYFCGFADDTALSEHHIIPKRIQKHTDDRTVTVCRNCHKKVHDLIDPIVDEFVDGNDGDPEEYDLVETVKEKKRRKSVGRIVKEIHDRRDEHGVPIEDVKAELRGEVDDIGEAIEQAKQNADIYEPKSGFVRPV